MRITKEQLTKFKAIYRQLIGKELDDKTAYDLALQFLNLMKHVYKPIAETDLKKANRRKQEL